MRSSTDDPTGCFDLTFVSVPRVGGDLEKTYRMVAVRSFSHHQTNTVVRPRTQNVTNFYRRKQRGEALAVEPGLCAVSRPISSSHCHPLLHSSVLQSSATASWLSCTEALIRRTHQHTPFALTRLTDPHLRHSKPLIWTHFVVS